MYIIHLFVYMKCKPCDRLSACALHLAQNKREIYHNVFSLSFKESS